MKVCDRKHFLEEDCNKKETDTNQNPINKKVDPSLNYRVNLFIDNSRLEGAPVIADTNYSYHNIL